MTIRALVVSAFVLSFALPAASFAAVGGGGGGAGAGNSGVTFGLGLSVTFGAGKPQTAVGIRVFSDDLQNSAVASLGLDYQFAARKLRPNVGVAYLGTNTYIGADLGFIAGQGLDFGLGLGVANTRKAVVAPAGGAGGGGAGGGT